MGIDQDSPDRVEFILQLEFPPPFFDETGHYVEILLFAWFKSL